MSGIAILKPDHIGDLVLSTPAIRAIAAAHPATTLFVASKNVRLARFLFPTVEIRAVDLSHLVKEGTAKPEPDLSSFDVVIVLRADQVLNQDWARLRTRYCLMPVENAHDHQSLIDYSVAYTVCGDYDMDGLFYGNGHAEVVARAVKAPRRIGLSLGSGFHANAWPLTRWMSLARELVDSVDEVVLLGGPAEMAKGTVILEHLGYSSRISSLVGRLDPVELVRRCEDLDLVIASDGGTGHLCSLTSPMLSVFGPSPFRRYAPYGRLNRVLTRDLACSPCCQYTMHLVNGCFTNECLGRLEVRHVRKAMSMPMTALSRARESALDADVRLYHGTSHLDRETKLAKFRREMADASLVAGRPSVQGGAVGS